MCVVYFLHVYCGWCWFELNAQGVHTVHVIAVWSISTGVLTQWKRAIQININKGIFCVFQVHPKVSCVPEWLVRLPAVRVCWPAGSLWWEQCGASLRYRRTGPPQSVPAAAGWENPGLHGPLPGMSNKKATHSSTQVFIFTNTNGSTKHKPPVLPRPAFRAVKIEKHSTECRPPSKFNYPPN